MNPDFQARNHVDVGRCGRCEARIRHFADAASMSAYSDATWRGRGLPRLFMDGGEEASRRTAAGRGIGTRLPRCRHRDVNASISGGWRTTNFRLGPAITSGIGEGCETSGSRRRAGRLVALCSRSADHRSMSVTPQINISSSPAKAIDLMFASSVERIVASGEAPTRGPGR